MVLSHGTGVRIPVPVPSFARLNRERASDGKPASSRHQQAKDVHRSSRSIQASEGGPHSVTSSYTSESTLAITRRRHFPDCNCSFRSRVLSEVLPGSRVIRHGKFIAQCTLVLKRFLYVLRNHENPPKYYTGITSHVATRHAEHNAGSCTHTAKHRPWSIDVVIEFADERRAIALERYLKSGSGIAFANRHLR